MKNELSLLIQCSRSRLAENHKVRIRSLLQQEIDWQQVIDSALRHKVLLLLEKNLALHFQNDVPPKALKDLAALAHSISMRNMALSAALIRTLALLNDKGIEVLPVKGPLLAQRLYGSYAMRSYGDLDILVRRQDIPKALDILLDNGYALSPKDIPRAMYDRFMRRAYHGRVVDPDGITIELHWELSGFFVAPALTLESLRPYLVKTQFCGRPCLDLTNEMLFFYLCIHGLKHRFGKLDLICSAAEMLQSPAGLDWRQVFALAREHKIQKGILFSLFLIGKICTIEPVDLVSELSVIPPKTIERLRSIVEMESYHLFDGDAEYLAADCFDDRGEELRYYLRAKFIPHQEDWEVVQFSPSLFFLYFIKKGNKVLLLSLNHRIRNFLGLSSHWVKNSR